MNKENSFPKNNKNDWEKKAFEETSKKEVLEALSFYPDQNLKVYPYYDETDLPTKKHFGLGLTHTFEEKKYGRIWSYIQNIYINDEHLTNKKILYALQNGAEGIMYHIQKNYNWDILFQDIFFEYSHSFFCFKREHIHTEIKKIHTAIHKKVFLGGGIKTNITSSDDLLRLWDLFYPIEGLKIVSLNGDILQEKGANPPFELASISTSFIFQVNTLLDAGVLITDILKKVIVFTTTGRDFFYEIAKLRAIRVLISKIALEYGLKDFDANDICIYSRPSLQNYSTLEADNHIIRTTTQALSSVIGGCNYLSISDMVADTSTDNIFFSTLMRNISHIFQYESYLDKVADPFAGSYYVENLTESLLRSAWEYLRELEKKGGWEILQKNNFFETELEKFHTKEKESLHKDHFTMVGVNAFIDTLSQSRLPTAAEYTKFIEEYQISPIAKELELIRLETEEYVKNNTIRPCVFLYGLAEKQPSSREISYVQNFFSVGGFATQIITAKELEIREIKVIILCGSDDEYSKDGKNSITQIKKRNPEAFVMLLTKSAENTFLFKTREDDEIISLHSDKREILKKVQKYFYG